MDLRHWRRRPAILAAAVAAGALSCLQCGAGGGASEQTAPVRIEPSRIYITVENTSAATLRTVQVHVVPHGEATLFSASPTSLAGGEKRDFPLGSFRGRDGTPLDLRVARIKSVRVTATDTQGKPLQAEVPWK